jgi:hypothetical protein
MIRFATTFLILVLVSGNVGASCFESHLVEAMDLNKKRRPMYAALSGGESLRITDGLLALESKMLAISSTVVNYDRMAKPFEERGIRVTCDSFIPMSQTPAFRGHWGLPDPSIHKLPSLKIQARLWLALAQGSREFVKESKEILEELSVEPRIYCLTRHFIESSARIAALIPIHMDEARRAGLASPAPIHRQMIRGHLYLLQSAINLDRRALPLQKQGLAIICGDVPPIPIP